ncbi:hypothetical protein LOK49_LG09G02812 [Camellia lanceoleosa]|uniref:Uncharacterized protein n=1 Tax=Camellia lanceoleosa TaxID=1840588 RepID=A0ACC0GGZ6_9ERIC|nr:hypothetical protein LOK49_LG09G02812 [Camellia lanceoleosa]
MIICYIVFVGFLVLLVIVVDTQNPILLFFSVVVISILFLVVHVYITALWHLASVVSVLEPVFGFGASVVLVVVLVFRYLAICGVINGVFGAVVVHGEGYGIFVRIMVGGFLVGVMVIVNLVGLMVQSVFYYICKSYHHQGIDKSALYDHLGGFLGEYVPLKSNIQMENLDV